MLHDCCGFVIYFRQIYKNTNYNQKIADKKSALLGGGALGMLLFGV